MGDCEVGQLSLPQSKLSCAQPSSHLQATRALIPPEVATIPARSSLDETSLGELLPGSILSDSLKQRFSQNQMGTGLSEGNGACVHLGLGCGMSLKGHSAHRTQEYREICSQSQPHTFHN